MTLMDDVQGRDSRGVSRIPPPTDADPSNRQLRLGAKAWLQESGRVLLVKERRLDGSTFWTLPGGGIRSDESIREALQRELMEELRISSSVGSILTSCLYEHESLGNIVSKYFVINCEFDGKPNPNPKEGIMEYCWAWSEDVPQSTLDPFQRLIEKRNFLLTEDTETVR